MTPLEIRTTVRTLKAQNKSLREISRFMKLSRNTVRRILSQSGPVDAKGQETPCEEETLVKLRAIFDRVNGNVVRVQELLAADGDEERSCVCST